MWQEFTPLAAPPPAGLGAVNCGQGFPDWPAPAFVKDALCAAVQADANQYTRSAGHPGLCRVLAARYGPLLGRGGPLDWENEVAVGVGSSETLYACMQALVAPGDEVVLISPAFDIYSAQVSMAGGTAVYVPLRLRGGEWTLDMAELRAVMSPRTRLLLVNTPQNPTGKVFSRAELEQIADIVAGFPRVVVLSDEVYENMLYDGREHVRMVRGMFLSSPHFFSCRLRFVVVRVAASFIHGHTHPPSICLSLCLSRAGDAAGHVGAHADGVLCR